METKKFYLPSVEISEEAHRWLKEKAEQEKRSISAQLAWEIEKLSKKEGNKK